jgi:hypothetical protein
MPDLALTRTEIDDLVAKVSVYDPNFFRHARESRHPGLNAPNPALYTYIRDVFAGVMMIRLRHSLIYATRY